MNKSQKMYTKCPICSEPLRRLAPEIKSWKWCDDCKAIIVNEWVAEVAAKSGFDKLP